MIISRRSNFVSFVILAVALAAPVFHAAAADVIWTNAAGNLLWSTGSNWKPNAGPSTADSLFFTNTVGATNFAGAVNNIVDANTTVAALRYSSIWSTNLGYTNFHTTLLNPGVTLTVNSNSPSSTVELRVSSSTNSFKWSSLTYATILGTGGATLAVGNLALPVFNTGGAGPLVWVNNQDQAADAQAVLDMSGLDNFTFAGSFVAVGGGSTAGRFEIGTMILAKTNFIKALAPYGNNAFGGILVSAHRGAADNTFDVGDFQLGQMNTIWTDALEVGVSRRGAGTLEFRSSLLGSNPTLVLRGTNGANRATQIMIGDMGENTLNRNVLEFSPGVVDFTGGTVDILAGNLIVGRTTAASGASSRKGDGNGTLTFTAGTIDVTTLNVGIQAGNNGGVGAGVVNVRTNAQLLAGSITIAIRNGSFTAGGAFGTLNITDGGSAFVTNAITDGTAGSSAINLTNNGTLHIGGNVTVDTLVLDNSRLHFLPGNTTDISGTAPMIFGAGGATIDTDVNNLSFNSAIGGATAGPLVKTGSGRLELKVASSYTGNTTVSNGTLRVSNPSGSATGSGAVNVVPGGALDGIGTIGGPLTVSGTLTPGASAPGTLSVANDTTLASALVNFEFGSNPAIVGGGVNDLVAVAGNLNLTGVTIINGIPTGLLSNAPNYTLFTYGGVLSGNASNLQITNSSPRILLSIVDPLTTPNAIKVSVSSTLAGSLTWRGQHPVNPTFWDVGTTTNWLNGVSGDRFYTGDPVVFDDTALSSVVALVGTIQPSQVSLSNNSTSYAIGGAGSLTVGGSLNLEGTASLLLTNAAADSFNGVNVEGGGAVTLQNNGTLSSGNINVANGSSVTVANNGSTTYGSVNVASGTLVFNQPLNTTANFPLTGAGTVTKSGTNTLTLSGDSSAFTGTMNVNNGTLRQVAVNNLGGSSVAINGGSLDINGITTTATSALSVQGTGYNGQGAIFNGSATSASLTTTPITLIGDTTLRAVTGPWEMHNTVFTGNGFKITKIGANEFKFGGNPGSANDLGDVDIQAGMFTFEDNASMGLTTSTITVRSNATLGFYGNNPSGDKLIVLSNSASLYAGGPAAASLSQFGGTMTLNGTNHVIYQDTAGKFLQYDGNIVGNGGLSLDTQGGTLILAGSNNFSGDIEVVAGAVRLANNFAAGSNKTINVHTIPVSGAGASTGVKVPHVDLVGGVVIPPGVTIHLNSAGATDYRNSLVSPTATVNEFQGALVPHGDGNILLYSVVAGSQLILSGPITNTAFALPGNIAINGAGDGMISGPVNINGQFEFNIGSAARWTFASTSNHWAFMDLETGTLALGTNDALCTTAALRMLFSSAPTAVTLDLAGYNQTVASLNTVAPAVVGNHKIGSTSVTTDSILTINDPATNSVINTIIQDSINGGTRTVGLTITNSKVFLNGANTYTGPTTVQNRGTLGGTGSLASPVTIESGGKLSPGASIGTLTMSSTLTNNPGSTNFFEVNASTLASDLVTGLSSVTYGGTLVISNVSVTPFANGNSFTLFSAASYSGAFAAIAPASPGAGLAWDTSNLAVNGTLAVVAATAAPNIDAAARLPDGNMQLTIAGTVGANYSVRASTNVTLPIGSWALINSGTITVSPFNYSDLTATNFNQRFYRISIP